MPGQLNFDQSENGNTRTNLVETNETQQEHETQGTDISNVTSDESFFCKLTGVKVNEPLQLPLNIC